jgi:hypothetical protein
MQPLFSSPALITNMQAIVSGAGLLKALVSSLASRILKPKIPGNKMIPRENIATMSGGIHSRTKEIPAKTSTANTRYICQYSERFSKNAPTK